MSPTALSKAYVDLPLSLAYALPTPLIGPFAKVDQGRTLLWGFMKKLPIYMGFPRARMKMWTVDETKGVCAWH